MKLMFILAAVCPLLFAYLGKGATGVLLSLLFLFLAAFFSKPRFTRKRE